MKIYIKRSNKFYKLKEAKLLGFYKKHPHNMYLIEHKGYKECYFECDVKIEEG